MSTENTFSACSKSCRQTQWDAMIPPLTMLFCHTTPTLNPESGTSLSRLDLHVPILIPSRWEVVGQFGTLLLDGNMLPKQTGGPWAIAQQD